MAIKKSQLYSTLWESCNALRGSMDASQYKDYVLMVLFVKYLSDKALRGERLLNVPEGCFFSDFVALKQNPNIGEEINKKLEKIKETNAPFIGTLTLPNFNDPVKLGQGKTMVDTLSKLIGVFENDALDFSKNRTADDDLLGDAYEYLMKNFAAESGKSKGQFYTPAEVSRIIAQVLCLNDYSTNRTTIYDPTCGSGSLLLRAMNETANGRASLYGQEKDSTTASLAQLNMLLHGINNAHILVGDTLNDPQFKEMGNIKTFDVCVANPPFSVKNWLETGKENDDYNRWTASLLPPAKCGDYAFLLHILHSMKTETGRGACILPHGVLFRGNTEAELRKKIVSSHVIKGIIGLPANLFFGTGIPACIIVMDKQETRSREGIVFIDAKDCGMKDGAKMRLREQDIRRIVDTWCNISNHPEIVVPHYARLVKWDEIEKNDFNLNIPRYIAPKDTEIQQNISAHLHGGLPVEDVKNMSDYWDACPTLRKALFEDAVDGMSKLKIAEDEVHTVIQSDSSFKQQRSNYEQALNKWASYVVPFMKLIDNKSIPKFLIDAWSEEILKVIPDQSLVDKYSVYDQLMNYWVETLQDDCYLISNDGWVLPEVAPSKKNGIYSDIVCDLLPVDIVLKEYFATEIAAIDKVQSELDITISQMDELEEEYADDDEYKDLQEYKDLSKQKKEQSKNLKSLQVALTTQVVERYTSLTTDEIKTLVVERKWIATIIARCQEEMTRVSNDIATEVLALHNRYCRPLTDIENSVAELTNTVNDYLKMMGIE